MEVSPKHAASSHTSNQISRKATSQGRAANLGQNGPGLHQSGSPSPATGSSASPNSIPAEQLLRLGGSHLSVMTTKQTANQQQTAEQKQLQKILLKKQRTEMSDDSRTSSQKQTLQNLKRIATKHSHFSQQSGATNQSHQVHNNNGSGMAVQGSTQTVSVVASKVEQTTSSQERKLRRRQRRQEKKDLRALQTQQLLQIQGSPHLEQTVSISTPLKRNSDEGMAQPDQYSRIKTKTGSEISAANSSAAVAPHKAIKKQRSHLSAFAQYEYFNGAAQSQARSSLNAGESLSPNETSSPGVVGEEPSIDGRELLGATLNLDMQKGKSGSSQGSRKQFGGMRQSQGSRRSRRNSCQIGASGSKALESTPTYPNIGNAMSAADQIRRQQTLETRHGPLFRRMQYQNKFQSRAERQALKDLNMLSLLEGDDLLNPLEPVPTKFGKKKTIRKSSILNSRVGLKQPGSSASSMSSELSDSSVQSGDRQGGQDDKPRINGEGAGDQKFLQLVADPSRGRLGTSFASQASKFSAQVGTSGKQLQPTLQYKKQNTKVSETKAKPTRQERRSSRRMLKDARFSFKKIGRMESLFLDHTAAELQDITVPSAATLKALEAHSSHNVLSALQEKHSTPQSYINSSVTPKKGTSRKQDSKAGDKESGGVRILYQDSQSRRSSVLNGLRRARTDLLDQERMRRPRKSSIISHQKIQMDSGGAKGHTSKQNLNGQEKALAGKSPVTQTTNSATPKQKIAEGIGQFPQAFGLMRQTTHAERINRRSSVPSRDLFDESMASAGIGNDSQRGLCADDREAMSLHDDDQSFFGAAVPESQKATYKGTNTIIEEASLSNPDETKSLQFPIQRLQQPGHLSELSCSDSNREQSQGNVQQAEDQLSGSQRGVAPAQEDPQKPTNGVVGTSEFNSKIFSTQKTSVKTESSDFKSQQDENRRLVQKAYLCYPEDGVKLIWDVFTSIVLVAACFMTPFGLAFEALDDSDNYNIFVFENGWTSIESIIDLVFIVEIIVCFNTSFYEAATNEYVTSRVKIAKQYCCGGWFWVDVMAIVPRFLRQLEQVGDFSKILSFMKIARIGRLIKLLRLLKMAKAFKQKEKMQKHMQTKMRLNVAKERLVIFCIFAILFVHTISCVWIFLGAFNMDNDSMNNWIDAFEFDITQMGSMYTIGLYWTITTITTVGYGDISATNTPERIIACIIMVIGVIAFSFSTGSLSSIIQNVDSRQAAYRQRLDVLKELRMTYGIDDKLYMELNAFINFQSLQRHQERDNFINELPDRLKYRLSELLFTEYRQKINFFKTLKEHSNFISWLCPMLRPLEVIQGALIQVESEKLTSINFIKEGEAAYVSQRCNNLPYKICPQGDHFGTLDICFRFREVQCKALLKQQSRDKKRQRKLRRMRKRQQRDDSSSVELSSSSSDSDSDSDDSVSSDSSSHDETSFSLKLKCKFTVAARRTCYLLQLEISAVEKMRNEFPEVWHSMITSEMAGCFDAVAKKILRIAQFDEAQLLAQQNGGEPQLDDDFMYDNRLAEPSQLPEFAEEAEQEDSFNSDDSDNSSFAGDSESGQEYDDFSDTRLNLKDRVQIEVDPMDGTPSPVKPLPSLDPVDEEESKGQKLDQTRANGIQAKRSKSLITRKNGKQEVLEIASQQLKDIEEVESSLYESSIGDSATPDDHGKKASKILVVPESGNVVASVEAKRKSKFTRRRHSLPSQAQDERLVAKEISSTPEAPREDCAAGNTSESRSPGRHKSVKDAQSVGTGSGSASHYAAKHGHLLPQIEIRFGSEAAPSPTLQCGQSTSQRIPAVSIDSASHRQDSLTSKQMEQIDPSSSIAVDAGNLLAPVSTGAENPQRQSSNPIHPLTMSTLKTTAIGGGGGHETHSELSQASLKSKQHQSVAGDEALARESNRSSISAKRKSRRESVRSNKTDQQSHEDSHSQKSQTSDVHGNRHRSHSRSSIAKISSNSQQPKTGGQGAPQAPTAPRGSATFKALASLKEGGLTLQGASETLKSMATTIGGGVGKEQRRRSLKEEQQFVSRLQKVLDEEEKLVMEGFAHDVSSKKEAGKQAKQMTKQLNKDKRLSQARHSRVLTMKNSEFQRTYSSHSNAAVGSGMIHPHHTRQSSKGGGGNLGRPSEKSNTMLGEDMDDWLLSDQDPWSSNKKNALNLHSSSPLKSIIPKKRHSEIGSFETKKMMTIGPVGGASPVGSKHKRQQSLYHTLGNQKGAPPTGGVSNVSQDGGGSKLEQLMLMSKQFQELIIDKVSKLQQEVSDVKNEQERLMRKSNQIRQGHRHLIEMAGSKSEHESAYQQSETESHKLLPPARHVSSSAALGIKSSTYKVENFLRQKDSLVTKSAQFKRSRNADKDRRNSTVIGSSHSDLKIACSEGGSSQNVLQIPHQPVKSTSNASNTSSVSNIHVRALRDSTHFSASKSQSCSPRKRKSSFARSDQKQSPRSRHLGEEERKSNDHQQMDINDKFYNSLSSKQSSSTPQLSIDENLESDQFERDGYPVEREEQKDQSVPRGAGMQ